MSIFKKRKLNQLEDPLPDEIKCSSKAQKRDSRQDTNIKANNGFLCGCNIYLHSASLSKSRKTLFENQVLSNSGKLISNLSLIKNVERTIILIDDNLIDKDRISRMIEKIQSSNSIKDNR